MTQFLCFYIGACFGSFFSLYLTRFPNASILFPRSHCDSCQHPLSIWELIPLCSYFLCRGKCVHCQSKIPINTILFELLFAFHSLILLWDIQFFILSTLSLLLLLFDIKYHSYPFLLWLVLTLLLLPFQKINLTFFIFLLFSLLTTFKNLKIGNGDFLYLASLSLIENFATCLIIIQLAAFSGISYILFRKEKGGIPFIPFLALAWYFLKFNDAIIN